MSDIETHMKDRNNRYYSNAQKDSFATNLKGLAVIEVCITELCTRKCGFCPRADKNVYPNKRLFMSLETIESIGRECALNGYEGDFHFSGFGESLTHPDFFEVVKTLRNILPFNHFALTSNGDLLDEEICGKIYESGINHIILSCYDGPDAYKKFDEILKPFNQSYEIRELWIAPEETLEQMAKRNNFNNRSGAVSTVNFEDNLKTYKNNPCYLPFYKLVIDYNGDILLCCNDWFRKHKGFGNINTTSLKDIWFSEEFEDVRKKLKVGERSGPACSTCSIRGDLVGIESVKVL
jgi:radical SAM protein with 4Fe4S-binding SPASM domain